MPFCLYSSKQIHVHVCLYLDEPTHRSVFFLWSIKGKFSLILSLHAGVPPLTLLRTSFSYLCIGVPALSLLPTFPLVIPLHWCFCFYTLARIPSLSPLRWCRCSHIFVHIPSFIPVRCCFCSHSCTHPSLYSPHPVQPFFLMSCYSFFSCLLLTLHSDFHFCMWCHY